tara:strand:- start:236 stop:754 length:519 start_codon:yes stop_codon:yes gene_type:complete
MGIKRKTRRNKRGGADVSSQVPALQQNGYTCGNSPQSEAACKQTSSNQAQNNLNNMSGGNDGCSQSSKISVVTFSPNDVSPVNASSLALNNTTQLVQGASDAQGDNVPKSTMPSNVTVQNGGIKKTKKTKKTKRKRKQKSRNRYGGKTKKKWGCYSGGRKKTKKMTRRRRRR